MNRRNFLRSMIGGVATAAAVRTFPFRVFSFPTDIVIPDTPLDFKVASILQDLRDDVLYDDFFVDAAWMKKLRSNLRYEVSVGTEMPTPFHYN